jgi:uncharacterized heparinase superfamily protein
MPALATVARTMRRAVGLGRAARTAVAFDLVPASLRAADPAFLLELQDGRFALAAGVHRMTETDPFLATAVTAPVLRELYGFSWLRHLEVARSEGAEREARRLLLAWRRSSARRHPIAREPAVLARRAHSLLAHADAGLAGADPAAYDGIMALVTETFEQLADDLPRMPLALARATAIAALTGYQLCRGDTAARRAIERRLAVELDRQILADGGHISRNPAALLDLALDLLPLRRLYISAQVPVPPPLHAALLRARGMLTLLLHTDQQLARVNGMGPTPQAELSAVMLQMQALGGLNAQVPAGHAAASGYLRLDAGRTVVIVDTGAPRDTLPGDAPFAGSLALEISSGRAPLITHPGADGPWLAPASPAVRTTAAHATLTLADTPSTPLNGGRSGVFKAHLEPREGPTSPHVATISSTAYRERLGYTHTRQLWLAADGLTIRCEDRLEPAGAEPAPDHPYAIRLPLHPSVYVDTDPATGGLILAAADGVRWRFAAEQAAISLDPIPAFQMASGPRPSLQIVLAVRTGSQRTVRWTLTRLDLPGPHV